MRKLITLAGLSVLVSGCKLAVISTEGGDIHFQSGAPGCNAGDVCTVSITEINYSEALTAIPREGYEFYKWKSGDRFVCGDSTNATCSIELTGDALAQAIVDSDQTFYALPLYNFVDIDTDSDGLLNEDDPDDDNDGFPDGEDLCPLDPDPLCGIASEFEDYISNDNDDAEERISTGDITRTSNDLDLVGGGFGASSSYVIGLRFSGSEIPPGVIITKAYISFTADSAGNGGEVELLIRAEEDDTSSFGASNYDITQRNLTYEQVSWAFSADLAAGDVLQSPDISEIVQAIVDAPGWSAPDEEDDMTFVLYPIGGGTGSQEVYSRDGAGSIDQRPRLHIQYLEGP